MKRILVLVVSLILAAATWLPAGAQTVSNIKPIVAASSLTTATCAGASINSTGCIGVNMGGYQHISFNLTGTWTGTVTFECSADSGVSWNALNVFPINGTQTAVTTATANGLWGNWTQPVVVTQCRARFSTATSGTVVVTLRASQ